MWLETLIKILIGSALYGFFGEYINNLLYYFMYSIKFVWSWFRLVFEVLWASELSINALYYVLMASMWFYVFRIMKKFIT